MKCTKCGYQFPILEKEEKAITYQIIQKGIPLPEKVNFCPHCGSNLMNEKANLEFCPLCGEKIDQDYGYCSKTIFADFFYF